MPYSKDELLNDALRNALKIWKNFTQKLAELVAKTPEPTRFETWKEVIEIAYLLEALQEKWTSFQYHVDNKTADRLTTEKATILSLILLPITNAIDEYNNGVSIARQDAPVERVELEDLNKLIGKLMTLVPNPCPSVLQQPRNKNKELGLMAVKALPFAGFFLALPIVGIFVGCLAAFGGCFAVAPLRSKYHLDDPRPDSQRLIETLSVRLGHVQHILADRLRYKPISHKAS